MPQVHNRELLRELGGAMKNPRFMASNYSDSTRKRIAIINKVQQKIHNIKVQVIDRNIRQSEGRSRHLVQKYQDSLRAIEAYQHVVTLNMFPDTKCPRDSKEYKMALNRKYNYDALKGKVRQTLVELDPATLRANKAKNRLDECRDDYARVLQRNLERIEGRSASKRQRYNVDVKSVQSDEEDEQSLDGEDVANIPFASKKIIGRRQIPPLSKEGLNKQFHGLETRILGRPFLQRDGKGKSVRQTPVSRLSTHRTTPDTPQSRTHSRSVQLTPTPGQHPASRGQRPKSRGE